MNYFAGIFWLVLAQLQNRFFVEHLPVAAYVRCLKEKEWKKWNSVFLLYSVWHSSSWHCKDQSGKKEQIKNISISKMKKKLRTAILKQNLLILMKKRECNVPTAQMPIFALFLRDGVLFDGAFSLWVSLNLTITFSLQYDKSLSIFVFTLVLNQVKSYLNMAKQKLTPFQETWN